MPLYRATRVAAWIVSLVMVAVVAAAGRGAARDRSSEGATDPFRRSAWVSVGGIDGPVLDLALGAASCAVRSGAVTDPATLTVIDYSKPSTERRLWVYDLRARTLLFEEWVAHGQASGDNVATRFSNVPESHASSLGLFVTDTTYVGANGYSLRLNGLDRGFNDLARVRAIVMHGASYVSPTLAKAIGRLGRSWGCPAIRPGVSRDLIDRQRAYRASVAGGVGRAQERVVDGLLRGVERGFEQA